MPYKLSPYIGSPPLFDADSTEIDSIISKIAPSSSVPPSISFDSSLYVWDDQKRLGVLSFAIINQTVHLKFFPYLHFVRFYNISSMLQYVVEALPSHIGFMPTHYYLYYRDTSQSDSFLSLPTVPNLSFKKI